MSATEPQTFHECTNNRFISAEEIGGMWTVVVARILREELVDETGAAQMRTTMAIANKTGEVHPKRIVLNRTNLEALRAMFGDRVADWIGKRIFLHAVPDVFRGKPGIRIYGSPDIAAPVTYELRLPKKKPQRVTMQNEKPKQKDAPA